MYVYMFAIFYCLNFLVLVKLQSFILNFAICTFNSVGSFFLTIILYEFFTIYSVSMMFTSSNNFMVILEYVLGVGTLFKRVAPVNKYRSLNDWVKVGDCIENEQQLKDILPDLVEK